MVPVPSTSTPQMVLSKMFQEESTSLNTLNPMEGLTLHLPTTPSTLRTSLVIQWLGLCRFGPWLGSWDPACMPFSQETKVWSRSNIATNSIQNFFLKKKNNLSACFNSSSFFLSFFFPFLLKTIDSRQRLLLRGNHSLLVWNKPENPLHLSSSSPHTPKPSSRACLHCPISAPSSRLIS